LIISAVFDYFKEQKSAYITFLKISAAMGIVELTGLEMMAIMASGHT
jgi:hypothetical protein